MLKKLPSPAAEPVAVDFAATSEDAPVANDNEAAETETEPGPTEEEAKPAAPARHRRKPES